MGNDISTEIPAFIGEKIANLDIYMINNYLEKESDYIERLTDEFKSLVNKREAFKKRIIFSEQKINDLTKRTQLMFKDQNDLLFEKEQLRLLLIEMNHCVDQQEKKVDLINEALTEMKSRKEQIEKIIQSIK